MQSNGKPEVGGGGPSAGELIGYPSAIERDILSRAEKLLRKPRRSVPFFKPVHDDRRRSRPQAQGTRAARTQDDPRKERMLVEWCEVRLAWIEATRGGGLRNGACPIISGDPERVGVASIYRLA